MSLGCGLVRTRIQKSVNTWEAKYTKTEDLLDPKRTNNPSDLNKRKK